MYYIKVVKMKAAYYGLGELSRHQFATWQDTLR